MVSNTVDILHGCYELGWNRMRTYRKRCIWRHTGFISDKIDFLMDALLGMINLEQNKIIKIFSIAAVVLLPPTLVASIYGMNFESMPELKWPWDYPLALVLMALAGAAPYVYFRRKGWLH